MYDYLANFAYCDAMIICSISVTSLQTNEFKVLEEDLLEL